MEGIKALFRNKYWLMMTGMLALFFLMYSVNGGSTVFYAKDILGSKDLVALINGIFNGADCRHVLYRHAGKAAG